MWVIYIAGLVQDAIDAIYKASWGCHTALKAPDSCTVDWYGNNTYVYCCNAFAWYVLGKRIKWVDPYRHIFEELGSGRSGSAAVVTRLADILFMQAVRAYLDENLDTAESGWPAALRDQQIGRALVLLHDKPHQPWTVAELADRVALSRSAFAAKFTQLVGEPPLHYLTRLRLNIATARLRSGNDKLSVIAAAAGYDSVPAFAKAFKRHIGVTPGEYRRSRQKGGSI
jgi:AraC-like DNA-binding protein